MGSGLQTVRDLLDLPVRADELVLEVRGAREESVEQVDHVPVGIGGNEVLAVQATSGFQTQTLRRLVLDAEAGLRPELGERAVVLDAKRRIDDPRAALPLVVEVTGKLGGVLGLLHGHPEGIERPEIRPESYGLDSVARLVVSEDILEVEPEVEAVDLAEAVR